MSNMSLSPIIDDLVCNFAPSSTKIDELHLAVTKLPIQDNLINVEQATKIWNFTTRLTAGKPEDSTLLAIARIRHQASLIVLKGGNNNLAVTMGLKAALSWARAGVMNESYQLLKEIEKSVSSERFLDVLSTKAQLACFEGDLHSAEEILHEISQQSQEKASLTCWEIAINFYKQDNVNNTRYSVERAIKYGKGIVPDVKLSQMYRLLTTCYFEEGADVASCVTAARLAAELDTCAESQLLLVKCLAVADHGDLLNQRLELIKDGLEDWLPEALDIALEYGNAATASNILSNYSNITTSHTKLLLLKSQLSPESMDSLENISKTLQYLKDCNHSDKSRDNDTMIRARDLLWQAGVKMWDKSTYRAAEQLYTLCFELSEEADKNKLLRNVATCQIAQGEVDAAEITLSRVQSNDQQNSVLLYQIALQKGDEGKALELISSITDEGLLQTAAMLAFKTNQQTVAKETLTKAVRCSQDTHFVLVAIRCLLRLSTTPEEDVNLFNLVESMQTEHLSESELAYLVDTAWNCSLKARPAYTTMIELLKTCASLLGLMKTPLTPQYQGRLRSCYLLMTAACLQLTDTATDRHQEFLRQAMEHISQFKSLGNDNLDQTTTLMLILYELECAVRLGLPEATSLVTCVVSVPYITAKTMNRVVRICLMGKDSSVTHIAIRSAIDQHTREENPDWRTISKLFMQLTKFTPNFTQLFKLWTQHVDKFPEDEAAWMVCEAWNRGVTRDNVTAAQSHAAVHDHHDDGGVTRELCGLALEVTQQLPNYRDVYERHMKPILEVEQDNSELSDVCV